MRSVLLVLGTVLIELLKALMAAASHLRRFFAQWAGSAWAGKVLPVWVYASVYVSKRMLAFLPFEKVCSLRTRGLRRGFPCSLSASATFQLSILCVAWPVGGCLGLVHA